MEYMTLHMRDMENQEIGRARQLVRLIDNLTLTVGECEQACQMCKITIQDYKEAKELLQNYGE